MLQEANKSTAQNAKPPNDNWHTQTYEAVSSALKVDIQSGITADEAQKRITEYGANELEEKAGKTVWAILYEQMTNPLVLLLIAAAGISGLLGKWDSFIAIVAIVILNAVLGVVQEYRAEQAMAALKKMSAPMVRVKRGGSLLDIPSREVVPGDLILLEAGSVVPADARLIESAALRVAEAALTGESQPVEKVITPITDLNAPLGDRYNMVYMGTSVAYGRGTAIVTGTGMKTQLGRIAELIQTVDADKTPLQRRLDELGKVLLYGALVVMVIAFIVGLIAGVPILPPAGDPEAESVILNAVAIAVAVVPEGLPAVVTIALALGAQRMLRRRALIRKLAAVETLGSVTVICSDKTGTLTENRMTVRIVDVGGQSETIDMVLGHKTEKFDYTTSQEMTIFGGSLCSDAVIQPHPETGADEIIGDPTEGAFVVASKRYGVEKSHLESVLPRVGEVPFDSDRKRMTTIHQLSKINPTSPESQFIKDIDLKEQGFVAFTKGGVDNLLSVSSQVLLDNKVQDLTPELRERITNSNNQMASQGLRVLGVGYRLLTEVPKSPNVENTEHDIVFVGMVGIIDPPRKEVADAVKVCLTAGVRPIMITGDHPLTAYAIAKDLGIAKEGETVLTGHDLNKLSSEKLRETVKTINVYARVSPENKLQIVSALQENGEVTAMTGDGVNDAPALKRANIGVAMGITGTAVSKEASDMVLLDDNFATIVSSVEEGRTIYDNVRRFIKYLLASNTGELFVLLATQLVAGMGLPLTTLQILWMNLITDGVPALALGVEGAEKGAMKRPPYLPNESLFGRGLGRHIVMVGLIMGITGVSLGVWAHNIYQTDAIAVMNQQTPEAPITREQFVLAQSVTSVSDPVVAQADADRIGITLEQLTAIKSPEGIATGDYSNNTWNTMVFMFLTIAQMGHALALRSHRESLFSMNIFSNRLLIGAVVVTVILQLIAVYTPFFNDLFNTTPLTATQLLICAVLSTVVFVGVEIEKLLIRRNVLS
jgi:P-type Ca2+ transporter type 2C